jgi:hypothetical protein
LVRYYANLFKCPESEISLDADFDTEIMKWRRCELAGDVDRISSEWNDMRRESVVSRASSVVRLSQQDDYGRHVTQFGKVIHFFVHKFRDTERMLAYVQIYHASDLSLPLGCSQEIRFFGSTEMGLKKLSV